MLGVNSAQFEGAEEHDQDDAPDAADQPPDVAGVRVSAWPATPLGSPVGVNAPGTKGVHNTAEVRSCNMACLELQTYGGRSGREERNHNCSICASAA